MSHKKMLPALVALGVLGTVSAAAAQQPVAIAAPPGGSIYNKTASVIGGVLAKNAGMNLTVQARGGSSQYLPIVNAGRVPFGIANVYETNLAVNGQSYYKGRAQKDIRSVVILYPLRNTLFVKKDSKYKTIADLKGARAPVGFTNQKILTVVTNASLAPGNTSLDDMKGVRVSNIISNVNAFKEGRTDFFVFALGAPPIREADAAVGGVRALTVPKDTPEVLAKIKAKVPVAYLRHEKPGKGKVGLLEPGYIVSYGVNIFASTKTPDDVVYNLVKAMHAHATEFGKAFPPLRLFKKDAMAQQIPGVEYHAGAIKFYKEIGQWPPKKN